MRRAPPLIRERAGSSGQNDMLVTCPSCRSSYRLADTALAKGRMLRCARCSMQWFEPGSDESGEFDETTLPPEPIMAFDDEAPVEAVETKFISEPSEPEPPSVGPTPSRPRVRKKAPAVWRQKVASVRPVVWIASAGAATLALLLVARVDAVRAAPSLATLYAAIGLDVNVRGLEIRDVRSTEELDEGVPLLQVAGSIENVTNHAVSVPRLRLSIQSSDQREVYAWTTVAANPELAPGASTTFRARLASPPVDGAGIAVRFLGQNDIIRPSR